MCWRGRSTMLLSAPTHSNSSLFIAICNYKAIHDQPFEQLISYNISILVQHFPPYLRIVRYLVHQCVMSLRLFFDVFIGT